MFNDKCTLDWIYSVNVSRSTHTIDTYSSIETGAAEVSLFHILKCKLECLVPYTWNVYKKTPFCQSVETSLIQTHASSVYAYPPNTLTYYWNINWFCQNWDWLIQRFLFFQSNHKYWTYCTQFIDINSLFAFNRYLQTSAFLSDKPCRPPDLL